VDQKKILQKILLGGRKYCAAARTIDHGVGDGGKEPADIEDGE
jgi:hypothetical protein